jgi:hypothetical protein
MANQVGVQVTRTTAGPLAFGADPGDSFLIALLTERGPADVPTLITSFSRFQSVFGGATPFSDGDRYSVGHEVLRRFFDKGGRVGYVLRVVGSGALEAYTDLQDRAGTPLDTLRVYGKGEGTWANDFDVKVSDGTRSDTFKLEVLDANGDVVETWDNLKMTDAHLARVNDGSDYIRLEDLDSATAAPDNIPAAGTFDLGVDQAGVDDNGPVAADIVGTSNDGVKTGLKAFRDATYGRGFVVAPDLDDDQTVRDELIEQSEAFFRMYLTSAKEGVTPSTAITNKSGLEAFNTLTYYPRPVVEDEETGELKAIPSVGHIVADWISAIEAKGPAKAPAGRDFRINFVRGLERQSNGQPLVDAGVAETLLANGINPIWDRDGRGAKCWGGRTTSDDAAWQYAHAGYLWCRIGHAVQEALDQLVYEVADPLFFSQVRMGIRSFLIDLHRQGAFRGAVPGANDNPDPEAHAFAVKCDESLLSDADKNNGIVRVEIWFRPAGVAETIKVQLAKRNE